ncbi:uncharacterized protein JCM15063_002191 [Sporobolomyces koalae]|uniref:uncharacterized protein n=1 Tax=Sporobolomyces koalae TaxID=500713 RepID=UPI00317A1A34
MWANLNLKSLQDKFQESLHDLESSLAAVTPPVLPASTSQPASPAGPAPNSSPRRPPQSITTHQSPTRSASGSSISLPLSPTSLSNAQQSASQLADSALSSLRASLRKGRQSFDAARASLDGGAAQATASPTARRTTSMDSVRSLPDSIKERELEDKGKGKLADLTENDEQELVPPAKKAPVNLVDDDDDEQKVKSTNPTKTTIGESQSNIAPVKEEIEDDQHDEDAWGVGGGDDSADIEALADPSTSSNILVDLGSLEQASSASSDPTASNSTSDVPGGPAPPASENLITEEDLSSLSKHRDIPMIAALKQESANAETDLSADTPRPITMGLDLPEAEVPEKALDDLEPEEEDGWDLPEVEAEAEEEETPVVDEEDKTCLHPPAKASESETQHESEIAAENSVEHTRDPQAISEGDGHTPEEVLLDKETPVTTEKEVTNKTTSDSELLVEEEAAEHASEADATEEEQATEREPDETSHAVSAGETEELAPIALEQASIEEPTTEPVPAPSEQATNADNVVAPAPESSEEPALVTESDLLGQTTEFSVDQALEEPVATTSNSKKMLNPLSEPFLPSTPPMTSAETMSSETLISDPDEVGPSEYPQDIEDLVNSEVVPPTASDPGPLQEADSEKSPVSAEGESAQSTEPIETSPEESVAIENPTESESTETDEQESGQDLLPVLEPTLIEQPESSQQLGLGEETLSTDPVTADALLDEPEQRQEEEPSVELETESTLADQVKTPLEASDDQKTVDEVERIDAEQEDQTEVPAAEEVETELEKDERNLEADPLVSVQVEDERVERPTESSLEVGDGKESYENETIPSIGDEPNTVEREVEPPSDEPEQAAASSDSPEDVISEVSLDTAKPSSTTEDAKVLAPDAEEPTKEPLEAVAVKSPEIEPEQDEETDVPPVPSKDESVAGSISLPDVAEKSPEEKTSDRASQPTTADGTRTSAEPTHLDSQTSETRQLEVDAKPETSTVSSASESATLSQEPKFAELSAAHAQLQTLKASLDSLVSALIPSISTVDDTEALGAELRNLKAKADMGMDEVRRMAGQLDQRKSQVEELRETHRLEHQSQQAEIDALRDSLAIRNTALEESNDKLAAAEKAAENTKQEISKAAVEYDKLKLVAKEEEEKRVKALSLLRALRQKLVKNEQEKATNDEELEKARKAEKDALDTLKTDRARFDKEIVSLRTAHEAQITKLRSGFEREAQGLKERYEKEAVSKRGQFELDAIHFKATQAKEIAAKDARIAQLEAAVKDLTKSRDQLFEEAQSKTEEIEAFKADESVLKGRSGEIEYELQEAKDRIAALVDELDEAKRSKRETNRDDSNARKLLAETETRHEARIRDLESRAKQLEKDRQETEEEMGRNMQDRLKEVERMRAALAQKDLDYAESVQSSQKQEAKIADAEKAKANLEKRLKNLEELLKSVKEDADKAASAEIAVREELSDRMQRSAELEARLEDVQTKESTLRSNNKTLREELRKLQSGVLLSEKQRHPGVGYFSSFASSGNGSNNNNAGTPEAAMTPSSVAISPSASVSSLASGATGGLVGNARANGSADEALNFEYLRNVILQFLEKPEMRPHLIAVLGVILHFTPAESRRLIAKVGH